MKDVVVIDYNSDGVVMKGRANKPWPNGDGFEDGWFLICDHEGECWFFSLLKGITDGATG